MQTALQVVATIAIIVVAVGFIALVRGVLGGLGKIVKTSEDASHFLRIAEEELAGTASEVRSAVSDVDRLVLKATETVERIDNVAEIGERLMDGAFVASSVAKTVKSSTATLISVYEGVKQGIRILRGSQETKKGGTSNEQK